MAEEMECSALVVIIDTNPSQRIFREMTYVLTQILESVIAFSNSHLMMKCNNKLAIIACHSLHSKFLYPSPGGDDDLYDDGDVRNIQQVDGQYELFMLVDKTVRKSVHSLISCGDQGNPKPSEDNSTCCSAGDSLLAGSLSMALCYLHRLNKEKSSGMKMNSRILVVTASGDESASQYMNFMNAFFTAQKCNIVIDVCSLDQDHGLLQQGCDISGGLYLKIPQTQGLLQYLLFSASLVPSAPPVTQCSKPQPPYRSGPRRGGSN